MADNEITLPVSIPETIEVDVEVDVGDAASAKNAEAWAVGKRGGVDVPDTDETYHNNAKYYAGQAAASADTASEHRVNAQAAANQAGQYMNAAAQSAIEAEGAVDDADTAAAVAESFARYAEEVVGAVAIQLGALLMDSNGDFYVLEEIT